MPYNPWDSKNSEPEGPFRAKDPDSFAKKKTFRQIFQDYDKNFGGNFGNRSIIKLGLAFVVALWLLSGFYVVAPDEKAIVLRFDKYVKTESPGLNYHIPFPVERIQKESVTTIRTTKIGFKGDTGVKRGESARFRGVDVNRMNQRFMLTGDENIIDMQFEIQWHIKDLNRYIFSVSEPSKTVSDVSQSVVREIVATNTLSSILTDGRAKIESDARDVIQSILDSYGAGIKVVLVQMLSADPPIQVVESFRDVQNARVDKESTINRANAHVNDALPKARGLISEIKNAAEAEAIEIVQSARSGSKKFLSVYNEYRNAKFVTKRRIYLETMADIFRSIDKTVVDDRGGTVKVILPFNSKYDAVNAKASVPVLDVDTKTS